MSKHRQNLAASAVLAKSMIDAPTIVAVITVAT
jgi:hypothetical protein